MRPIFLAAASVIGFVACGFSSAQVSTPDLCEEFVKTFPREKIEAVMANSDGDDIYDGKGMKYYAAIFGSHGKLKKWIAAKKEPTSFDRNILVDSVVAGQFESVKILVSSGLSPDFSDERGTTPLIVATGCGYSEIMSYLLKAGADPNAKNVDGIDPLIHAIMEENVDAVRLLLDSGFDLKRSKTKNGLSPLEVAKRKGNKEILEILKRKAQS